MSASLDHRSFEKESITRLDEYPYSFGNRLFHTTIGFHKFRTFVGVLLTILFLGLLLTNPLLLPTFISPLGYLLQSLVATLGMGVTPVAIMGSLLTLTAPKWIGNLLQFIGERIIGRFVDDSVDNEEKFYSTPGPPETGYVKHGGILDKVVILPYLLVAQAGLSLGVFEYTRENARIANWKDGIRFTDDVNFLLRALFMILASVTWVFAYSISIVGEGISQLGNLISGEYNYMEEEYVASYEEFKSSVSKITQLCENTSTEKEQPALNSSYKESQKKWLPADNSTESLSYDPAWIAPEWRYDAATYYRRFIAAVSETVGKYCPDSITVQEDHPYKSYKSP